MKLNELMERLDAKLVVEGDCERDITCGYAGDFLSNAIGKAPSQCAWFTVMNNVNVCAVATLADVGCVVLCEGVEPDDNLRDKAIMQSVNIISTELDVYRAVIAAGVIE